MTKSLMAMFISSAQARAFQAHHFEGQRIASLKMWFSTS